MQILNKANLSSYHTFALDVTCEVLVIVNTLEELKQVYRTPDWAGYRKLILGKGSNVLFTTHFHGVVIINRIKGIQVTDDNRHWRLHVCGGEDWPELVEWSVSEHYYGLENLALIPGCAGTAPIQNIGAYGVEFKDVCDYVDVLDLETLETNRLSCVQCEFGYRDSVFKHRLYEKVAIVAIGLKLPKQWQAITTYGNLSALPQEMLSPRKVFEAVCEIRSNKLPDPNVMGNAGSFFKNPLVSSQEYERLRLSFPNVIAYVSDDKYKLAAGWLIDQCGLKGVAVGGAMVHQQQALVLVNHDKAKVSDVVKLALHVQQKVYEKFQIMLEHEVRFFGADSETYLEHIDRERLK